MRPTTADPDIYRCLTFISMYNRGAGITTPPEDSEMIKLAKEAISIALDKEDTNCNSYFLRAVLYYSVGDFH